MPTLMLITGWVALFIGLHFCLTRRSEHDLEQASLLPFADDPDAARNMSRATGKTCERIMMIPTQAEADLIATQYIDA